jgi:hypothetical protein
LHAPANGWHLYRHIAHTSTGASAYAGAAVGDLVQLDRRLDGAF